MNKITNLLKNNLYAISLYSRRLAGAFSIFFIARYLSVYEYGLYASYVAIAGYMLLFANLGFNEYILVSTNNETKKVKFKQTFFISNAILLCFLYCLISLFIPIEERLIFVLIIFKIFFDETFFALILPYFQSAKKFNEIAFINFFYSFFIIIIACIALIFKFSLVKYLTLCILLGIINFMQCSSYLKINYFKIFKIFKSLNLIFDKSILYYVFVTLLFITKEQLPSLFIATTINKEIAALYFAAYNISMIPSLFAQAKLQQIMPEMINSSKKKIIETMKKSSFEIFAINAVVIILLAFLGKLLLLFVYGKAEYTNAYGFLIFLSVITLISGVLGPLGTYITASGNQKFKLRCQIEMLLIALISMIFLYKYGIYAILSTFFFVCAYSIPRFGFFVKKQLED